MKTQRLASATRRSANRLSPTGVPPMQKAKTLVATSGGIIEMDTVKLEDAWWLVCSWSDRLQTRPKRVVRLSGLPHEEVKGQTYRFVLSHQLPEELLVDQALPGFHVRTLP